MVSGSSVTAPATGAVARTGARDPAEVVAAIRREEAGVVFAAHVETASGIMLPDSYLRAISVRQAEVVKLIPKEGATAWDISRALFPDSTDVHRFLAVSEAVAHLDLAHTERKLAVEMSDGREVYRRA